tara:strand:- start:671 stop:871 length:201 start_codon:yes stop_codon:yes gene_type:complete
MNQVIFFVGRIAMIIVISVGAYFGVEAFLDGESPLASIGVALFSAAVLFALGWPYGPAKSDVSEKP